MSFQHTIYFAAKRSGLTPHLIRAWEKRYHAVAPHRTQTNRRLYADEDIERLHLLGDLTKAGHRIGDIARLPTPELAQMAATQGVAASPPHALPDGIDPEPGLKEALDAVARLDPERLEALLKRHAVALGQRGLLERFISPLARRIGDQWQAGHLSAAHEHFASNVLRNFLLSGASGFAGGAHAPVMIVTTPAGQLHELGAAMVAAYARDLGWRVLYLGPSLPAADIAHAARVNIARVVGLSIVHPADDTAVVRELTLLRGMLPAETVIIIGGESAGAYAPLLNPDGIIVTNDLGAFTGHLDRLRRSAITTAGAKERESGLRKAPRQPS